MARRLVVEADGGSRGNPGPAGYGAVVKDADTGEVLVEVAAGIGVATNNVAEYEGMIAGLAAVAAVAEVPDVSAVEVRMDSKLVVEQMSGRWQVRHPDMARLRREAAVLVGRLPAVTFRHVPRARNAHADRLANEAMDAAARGEAWVRRTPVREAAEPVEAPVTAPEPSRGTAWFAPDATPTTLLLVRHGQTPLSVERRFAGLGDADLTALGRAQATAVAARVAALAAGLPIVAVWTSPLRRARDTAAAVAAALPGVPTVVDDRLRETDFGDWEAASFAEVQARWPAELAAWLADPAVAPPGGEAFTSVAERAARARDAIVSAHAGAAVVVVSHVTPIKSLLRDALDAPTSALYRLHLDPASLSQVDAYADGQAVVRRVNDTGHLDRLGGRGP